MRRVGKGFSGVETPLFENMLAVRAVDADEEIQVPAQDDVVQEHVTKEIATEVVPPTPTSPSPSSPVIPSSPPYQSPYQPQPQAAKGSSQLIQQVLDTCYALVLRVEGLENANAAQQLEIIKLKARVKKLERLNKGRISVDMETDEGIKLEVDQENDAEVEGRHADTQAEIYNIDLDHSLKVLSMQEDTEVQEAVEVVTTAKLITEVVTAAATQVAAASTPIPAAKPKVLKIVVAPAISTRKRKGVTREEIEKEDEEIIKSINETILGDVWRLYKMKMMMYLLKLFHLLRRFTLEQLVNVARLQIEEEKFKIRLSSTEAVTRKTWVEMKVMLTEEFCPLEEIQMMECEL
nr:hypothetical protein [Tanacetum cinerariifolium]